MARRFKGQGASSEAGPSELVIEDLSVGQGDEAQRGSTVGVHYRGSLFDGTEFDATQYPSPPFFFKLGEGLVIQGWEQGIAGMRLGGTRRLTIPAHLAYGRKRVGSIPANSTLVFEVELKRLS